MRIFCRGSLEACVLVGLQKQRTKLQSLKNDWTKANVFEQADFLKWLSSRGFAPAAPPSILKSKVKIVAKSKRLSALPRPTISRALKAAEKFRIIELMSKRKIRMDVVMKELGLRSLNTSVGMALRQGTQVAQPTIEALEKWLIANSHH